MEKIEGNYENQNNSKCHYLEAKKYKKINPKLLLQ